MDDFASAEICFGIFFAFCSRRPNKKWFVLNSFGIETPWIINVRWPIREHAVTENWPINSNDRIHGPSSFWIEFPSWYSSLPRKTSSENIFSIVFTDEVSTGLKV